MSDVTIGAQARSLFALFDDDNAPILGATYDVLAAEGPDGLPFAFAIEERGGGVYRLTYTPTQAGSYDLILEFNTLPPQVWELHDSARGGSAATVTVSGTGGTSLLRLVQMVATMLNDLLQIQATSDGAADGSTWSDELNASAISPTSLKGSELFVTAASGDNQFKVARILDSTEGSPPTLTLVPPLPEQVMSGDTADVTNLESKGFRRNQYINAINTVIESLWPNYLVPITYDLPDAFSTTNPYLVVPDDFTHIRGVQWLYGDGVSWLPISRAYFNEPGWDGWAWDPFNARLVIAGRQSAAIGGASLRLLGYGRPGPLSLPTDRTGIDAEWLRNEAAALLGRSKGDAQRLALAQIDKSDADLLRAKMSTQLEADTIQIRW